MSNGASIVLEQAAARPEASVFLRPSVMADDDVVVAGCCCATVVVVDLDLAHPPPLGTVCKFMFDGALLGEIMESFACEIWTERKKRYNADSSAALLKETACLGFVIVRVQTIVPLLSYD